MWIIRCYKWVRFHHWVLRQEMRPEFFEVSVAAWLRKRGWFVVKLPDLFDEGCRQPVCYIEIYKKANRW
jgi:hypothetical protein